MGEDDDDAQSSTGVLNAMFVGDLGGRSSKHPLSKLWAGLKQQAGCAILAERVWHSGGGGAVT